MERGILFKGEWVRAILAGTKTQTRRIAMMTDAGRVALAGHCWHPQDPEAIKACPYGVPGDRLWVRETFEIESNRYIDSAEAYPPHFSDGRPIHWEESPDEGRVWSQPHYRATDPEPEFCYEDCGCEDEGPHCHWRPSIHMPRWASRITLEITDVRVQRLQEITPEDALAEGVTFARCDCEKTPEPRCAYDAYEAVQAFREKWDEINGKRASWASNPWVWAITFRRA